MNPPSAASAPQGSDSPRKDARYCSGLTPKRRRNAFEKAAGVAKPQACAARATLIVAYADSLSPVGALLPGDAAAAADPAALVELGKQLHRSIRYVSFRWNLGGLARLDAKEEAFVASREPGDSPEQLTAFYQAFDRDGIDEATYAEHARMLDEALAALDARLAGDGRPFLVGDVLSHADIIWSIKVLKLVECGYPLAARYPHLARWYARISSRASFRGGVMGRHRFMSGAFRLRATIDRWLGRGLSHALAARQG